MLIRFETVKHYITPKETELETTALYLNPAYIVSLAQDVKAKANGLALVYLTMASRGDPEEGNDYYKVVGKAEELTDRINKSCPGIGIPNGTVSPHA